MHSTILLLVALLSDLEADSAAKHRDRHLLLLLNMSLQLITPILLLPLFPIPALSPLITPFEELQLLYLSNRGLINQPLLIVRHSDRSGGRSVDRIPRVRGCSGLTQSRSGGEISCHQSIL